MNQDQKNRVAMMMTYMAQYYGKDLMKPVIAMMVEDLADLDFEKVMRAFESYRKDPKNSTFPLPARIRSIVMPEPDSRDLANALARKIDKTIAKFGWNWEHGEIVNGETYYLGGGRYHWTFKEALIAELGEVGYHAVASRGGWLNVRNSANDMQEGQFISQMRDQIESTHKLQKQGIDITQIEMPSSKIALPESPKDIKNLIEVKSLK